MTITDWCPICRRSEAEHTEQELARCQEVIRLEADVNPGDDEQP